MADQPALSGVPYSSFLTGGGDATGKAFIEVSKAGAATNRLVVGRPGLEQHLQDEVVLVIPTGPSVDMAPPVSLTTGQPITGYKFTKFPCQVVVQTEAIKIEALKDSPAQGLQVQFTQAYNRMLQGDFSAAAEMASLQAQASALVPPVLLTPWGTGGGK